MIKNEAIKRQGQFIVNNNSTIRAAAKFFGVSRCTIYKNVTERLEKIDPKLHYEVKKVLELNKKERALRGGLATKEKYIKLKEKA